jgi:hypothetical protein
MLTSISNIRLLINRCPNPSHLIIFKHPLIAEAIIVEDGSYAVLLTILIQLPIINPVILADAVKLLLDIRVKAFFELGFVLSNILGF